MDTPDQVIPSTRSGGVRALKRGLDVLREVNRSGGIRPGELAGRLGLARPTAYRLLETLEELGYVVRSASDDRFRVTRAASSLGDGYDVAVALGQIAGPILVELGRRLLWPVDLSVCENGAMLIEETTHGRSALSIDRGMIGRRLPILRTSAGRIYLASCPAEERQILIRYLRRIDEPEDRPYLVEPALQRLLDETAARGFGVRSGGEFNARTSSIAVPIVQDRTVLGCISVIWIRAALDLSAALTQFPRPLLDAAAAIANRATVDRSA